MSAVVTETTKIPKIVLNFMASARCQDIEILKMQNELQLLYCHLVRKMCLLLINTVQSINNTIHLLCNVESSSCLLDNGNLTTLAVFSDN